MITEQDIADLKQVWQLMFKREPLLTLNENPLDDTSAYGPEVFIDGGVSVYAAEGERHIKTITREETIPCTKYHLCRVVTICNYPHEPDDCDTEEVDEYLTFADAVTAAAEMLVGGYVAEFFASKAEAEYYAATEGM